jgi:hypothetical protein
VTLQSKDCLVHSSKHDGYSTTSCRKIDRETHKDQGVVAIYWITFLKSERKTIG